MKKILRNVFFRYLRPAKARTVHSQIVASELPENLRIIKETLGDSDDVVVRQFKIGIAEVEAFLLNIDGLTDKSFIAENIMKTLTVFNPVAEPRLLRSNILVKLVRESLITAGEVKEITDFQKVFSGVLSGDSALFIEGSEKALVISTRGYEGRGVEEPQTEAAVRGPREGFNENLRTNTALLRRKLKNPKLRLETVVLGRQTSTNICLAYIKGICDEKIAAEVKERLARVDTDAILESGYIEAFIEDAPFSPFSTVGYSERPDVVAGKLLEGRLAIIIDGTPMVLTVPHLFIEGFQMNEDYYLRPYYVTLQRWFRFLAFLLTIFSPAMYIALTTFNQEMIPTQLLITMAASREGVPFPAFVEALGMGVVFEILREAGVRMPRAVGQAVSIVGALVIGEAAVSAGLVGAPVIIVVALTAISSFVIPSKVEVTLIARLALTLFAGVAGFYGLFLGVLMGTIHLVSLRSFGVPYLSPLAPLVWSDLKDVFIRVPLWAMKTRPRVLVNNNWRRQEASLLPQLFRKR